MAPASVLSHRSQNPWLFSRTPYESPNRLMYAQVCWTRPETGLCFRIDSVVDLELDESDRITLMVDEWNGEELPTRYGVSGFDG